VAPWSANVYFEEFYTTLAGDAPSSNMVVLDTAVGALQQYVPVFSSTQPPNQAIGGTWNQVIT
jgi:hypothetical protein